MQNPVIINTPPLSGAELEALKDVRREFRFPLYLGDLMVGDFEDSTESIAEAVVGTVSGYTLEDFTYSAVGANEMGQVILSVVGVVKSISDM